jgi:hypothetical protein
MKNNITQLILFQILATSILMMMETNAGRFDSIKTNDEAKVGKDMEMESVQEKDIFPDLISFATHLYQ